MRRLRFLMLCLVVIAVTALTGCTTVTDQETQLGLSAFNRMKGEVPVSKDASANALVEKVGRRIAEVAKLPKAQWEFVVFESKEANAFCLPGGKVGVYSGILPITKDEGGLATVLGHEVAHAVAHHGRERISEALLLQTGGQIPGASLSSTDPRVQAATVTAYGLSAKLGRELPHSRKQESEADFIGLLFMARAGYDPAESVQLWERFAEFNRQSGGGTPWFLRNHPLDDQRIQALKDEMPRAKQAYVLHQ